MKVEEQKKAREMRRNGESIRIIAKELNVSKSSVSTWVRDISITEEQKNYLLDRGKLLSGSGKIEKCRETRKEHQRKGREKIRNGDFTSLYLTGCMLYWAEGLKSKNKNTVSFSNSDENMIKLFVEFLRTNFDIKNKEITIIIHCYLNNGLTQEEIERHWLNLLNLGKENLRKSQINNLPSSSNKHRKNVLKYGICNVRIHRTDIIQEIYGAIQEYGGFIEEKWLG